jgi:CBS domain-containing protein
VTVIGADVRPLHAVDIMTTPALTVAPSASLWEAWRLMMQAGVRHLVVCDGDQCAGVIDDRAVFAQWPMGPLALRRDRVGDVMRPRSICVLPDVELRTVAAVMIADGVDAVAVVEPDGSVIGIVTASDLAVAVAEYGVATPSV